jgi:hypothetical protein
MNQIRTWQVFLGIVILHLGLTYIDLRNESDGIASIATGTVLISACLAVVRFCTDAVTMGELWSWCSTRWRWTIVWGLATFIMVFQVVWLVTKSPVSAIHGISSTIFIGVFFAACCCFGVWLLASIPRAWRRLVRRFHTDS